ncbi:MAG TPA: formyltetrahydrofolate deformylase [Paludibacteraceae bacterium]|jgi:formyltetrahydrofolate deformylase|nr:MAG: Formyltetrahydrofolate deformylase [Bacteroidetes bacterium ADurb.BinA395]HOJ66891.1 formyltetrahydrofolate deformylase [Paludibacteraceae bacterium]HOL29576.1 formyltetrahydrofolate deformylase [Paludibacteraceae bacterium]HPD59890.1 formyltetrahydrofolate deformylase [Paludibacteraceae bacterium]HPQ13300.1 formyltetrahydrofolate deformylase [Paludibacteraceae bacterium]
MKGNDNTAILLIHCPDRPGILAAVTEFINRHQGNILYLDQYVNKEEKVFFMRVEWDLKDFQIPREKIEEYFNTLIAIRFEMIFRLYFADEVPRMAIFVSKLSHCLYDLLARYAAGEWKVEIPLIISNHKDLEPVAKRFGIDFYTFSINEKNKAEQEALELQLLKEKKVTFCVLARYMQILSPEFIQHYPNKIINIHHSFLPAFAGSKPYHAAYERGVKIIGATGHYVTEDLDAGPIISQDVTHISHKDNVEELIRKGRDLEKIVLSAAVEKHINRKILTYKNRTIVFQ